MVIENIMMQLGGGADVFQFGVDTAAYQTLTRSAEYKWPTQQLVGNRPARQFTGEGDSSVTLNGVIYPSYKGGLQQIQKVSKMARNGTPYILQDAKGVSWGKWCITGIEETHNAFFQGGIPRKISFRISLARY